jgi:hypothetical protein
VREPFGMRSGMLLTNPEQLGIVSQWQQSLIVT